MRFADLPRGFNHLVYFTIMQSRKLYAWETGAVDDRALILMCGDADFKVRCFPLVLHDGSLTRRLPRKITSSSLYIDRQRIRFVVPDAKSLLALRVLREQLSRLINASFRSPCVAASRTTSTLLSCSRSSHAAARHGARNRRPSSTSPPKRSAAAPTTAIACCRVEMPSSLDDELAMALMRLSTIDTAARCPSRHAALANLAATLRTHPSLNHTRIVDVGSPHWPALCMKSRGPSARMGMSGSHDGS